MSVPVVVFEWNPNWPQYWQGRWDSLFPFSEYGRVELDTHIYHFENNVQAQETDWNTSERDLVITIAKEAPLMIGEWTMSASEDIPTPDLQPWAEFIQSFMVSTGTLGSAHWLWSDVERDWWSMRKLSYLGTPGGVDWAQVFGGSQMTFIN